MSAIVKFLDALVERVKKIEGLGPLLARLTIGLVFVGTGWGKLHNLDGVTEFFTNLHLPAPAFQAKLVASTELIGGALIVLGLFTRLTALPLAFTMVIAIVTAKRAEVDGLLSLLGLEEFTYLIIFLWLALAGAGVFSIDRLIARWRRARTVT